MYILCSVYVCKDSWGPGVRGQSAETTTSSPYVGNDQWVPQSSRELVVNEGLLFPWLSLTHCVSAGLTWFSHAAVKHRKGSSREALLAVSRARSQEPGARSQEPGARNQEPGARSQEPGASVSQSWRCQTNTGTFLTVREVLRNPRKLSNKDVLVK